MAASNDFGLRTIFLDQRDTWSTRSGDGLRRDRARAYVRYFAVPTLAAVPIIAFRVDLGPASNLLPAVSVFTALLFGLLGLTFNTAVNLRKDRGALPKAHSATRAVSDLRANITYSIVVAIALVVVLASSAAVDGKEIPWWLSAVVVWLFFHLGLSVLSILRRFRTAFNYLSR